MKKLLFRLCLFSLLFWILLIFTDLCVSYKSYNSKLFVDKLSALTNEKKSYDAIFYGSSQTFRQVNPGIIKELTGLDSYNFGVGGNMGFEKNNTLISMLDDGVFDGTEYLFLESGLFYPSADQRKRKFGSSDSIYYYLSRDFFNEMLFTLSSSSDVTAKTMRVVSILKSYFFSRAKLIPHFKSIFSEPRFIVQPSDNGFVALDSQFGNRITPRRKELLENPDYLKKFLQISSHIRENYPEVYSSEVTTRYYESLIERCKKRNIHLVVLFLPRTLTLNSLEEGYYTPAITARLPEGYSLDLSDFRRFPELTDPLYNYDLRHFNNTGANIFSRYLAQELNNKIL